MSTTVLIADLSPPLGQRPQTCRPLGSVEGSSTLPAEWRIGDEFAQLAQLGMQAQGIRRVANALKPPASMVPAACGSSSATRRSSSARAAGLTARLSRSLSILACSRISFSSGPARSSALIPF